MKKTLFLLLAAISVTAANASTVTAEPTDTTCAYVIDGKVVRNFTGEELVGKTIKSYQVIPSVGDHNDGKGFCHVLLLHNITTDKAPAKTNDNNPVVFIDGVLHTYDDINTVKPEDIKSVDVIKNKELLAAYAKQGLSADALKNGVIRIVTKKQQTDPIVYLVNGTQKTSVEIKKIPSGNIKAINIIKKGSNSKYSKQYGSDVDIVEISTK